MCGIIAALTQDINLKKYILNGLQKLEYRGYDSAGYAYLDTSEQLQYHHTTKSISSLPTQTDNAHSLCAIAHTRWATHGGATTNNAHPHHSHEQLAIVHNGIIENHHTLKEALNKKMPISWRSETDSEVIAHSIYYYQQYEKTTIEEAIRRTCETLQGSYALAIIDKKRPNTLFTICHESPLLLGKAPNGFFIASDPVALQETTTEMLRLPNNVLLTINLDQVITTPTTQLSWQPTPKSSEQTVQLTAEHHTFAEILAQPSTLANLVTNYKEHVFPSINTILLQPPTSLTLLACGSSHYCAQIAKYWLESTLKLPVFVELASEFRYRNPYIDKTGLLVVISQSGETLDTLSALRYVKKQHPVPSLAIGNQPLSTIAQETDLFWPTYAGVEVGVATTKVFTAQLFCLQILQTMLSSTIPFNTHWEYLPTHISQLLTKREAVAACANTLLNHEKCIFLGRGPQYAIAQEACLKVQELSYIPCLAFAAGELKHGPIALIDKNTILVVLVSDDHYQEKLRANIAEVHARGGQVLVIGPERLVHAIHAQYQTVHTFAFTDNTDIYTTAFLHIVSMQLLAYYVAKEKGCAIDKPRNLAKCVSVE